MGAAELALQMYTLLQEAYRSPLKVAHTAATDWFMYTLLRYCL
jgi:hypothetical protein